jgi:uncharacterized protein YndB with AHSA1/START domain
VAAADAYRLQCTWKIEGSIDRVFHFLGHVTTFPSWWGAVFLAAESDATEPFVGARARVKAKSALPYVLDWDLVVTRLEPPHRIVLDSQVRLSWGVQLAGSIDYRLEQHGVLVHVITDQLMRPARPIPWPFGGLAGWLFRFNHAWAMKRGEAGLQRIVRES